MAECVSGSGRTREYESEFTQHKHSNRCSHTAYTHRRVLSWIKKPNGYLSPITTVYCQYNVYQCGHIRLCHLKAWPADDYLYAYTCVDNYLMLKSYNGQWSTGKLNPDPNGSEENQMECSIQKQPSENPAHRKYE